MVGRLAYNHPPLFYVGKVLEMPTEENEVTETETDETETASESTDADDSGSNADVDNDSEAGADADSAESPGESGSDADVDGDASVVAQLQAENEGLRVANGQLQADQAAQINELNTTITELRAELWAVTKTLPNDSVGNEETVSETDTSEITFDDLAAKATAKG